MPRRMIIVLWLILALTAGCSTIQQNKQQQPNPIKGPAVQQTPQADPVKLRVSQQAQRELADYLGLKVGRRWQYQGEGNEFATFTAVVTHAKGNLYQIEEDNGGTVLARVIALRDDGAYEVLTQGEHYSGKSLLNTVNTTPKAAKGTKILPWPLRRNVGWTLPDGSRARVISTNTSRTVPFGRLRNVVNIRVESPVQKQGTSATTGTGAGTSTQQAPSTVSRSKSTSVLDRYYAKGIGLIERRFTMDKNVVVSRLHRMTLISK